MAVEGGVLKKVSSREEAETLRPRVSFDEEGWTKNPPFRDSSELVERYAGWAMDQGSSAALLAPLVDFFGFLGFLGGCSPLEEAVDAPILLSDVSEAAGEDGGSSTARKGMPFTAFFGLEEIGRASCRERV